MNLRGTPLSKIHGSTPPPPPGSGSETHDNVLAAALDGLTREVKQQRRRRQQERQKSNGFNRQNNNFARVSRFFVHFFAVTTGPQYDGKLPNFYGIRAMNFETAR